MELDGFIGSERGSVSNSEIRREGSIFIRIDGRLDVRRTEPELWKNLRAQVEGSVDQHPGSPVFIDLRQVSHADAPSIQALVAAVSDAKANPELAKARKPRTPWQWVKGSTAEKEARKVLQPKQD